MHVLAEQFGVVDSNGRFWFGCWTREEADKVLVPQEYTVYRLAPNEVPECIHAPG